MTAPDPVVEVEHLSKSYRLALRANPTLHEAVSAWWRKRRGIPPPELTPSPHALPGPEDGVVTALSGLSFSLRHGEVVGILGRNGAGKTTLLRVLSGITPPSSGQAIIRGSLAPLLALGAGFHPRLSARENIYLDGAMLGMQRHEIEARFESIVRFAGLERYLDVPVKCFSGGMYMRLGFSIAIHMERDVVLIDEVLSVGDAEFRQRCLDKLLARAAGGSTILVVSHETALIGSLCSRALLLDRGRLVRDGAAAEVAEHYLRGIPAAADF